MMMTTFLELIGVLAHGQSASDVSSGATTTITNIFTALGTFVTNNAEILITTAVFIGIVGYAFSRLGIRIK